jgi:hypothetical protein
MAALRKVGYYDFDDIRGHKSSSLTILACHCDRVIRV